ncbi:MAG: response regulator transcription factor [Verrucomicrobiota bacterium]|jgi:DNA-binding NarL/FixJ family response regulator
MTTVAIVEDNNIMRKTLMELIDSAPGYRCVCACTTSKEAQIQIPKHCPEVVLMDIHLPDESGIACTARLTEKMPALQVIMVTVYKDIELIFQALKAGACGYILKRFSPDEILQAIAEVRAGGAPMTSEIARMVVRSFRAPLSGAGEKEGLSTRETEILALLAEGLSNKGIAEKLSISTGTVRTHLMHIFKKLHVRCRTEAAAKFFRAKQPGSSGGLIS